jgi:hypothetical protein
MEGSCCYRGRKYFPVLYYCICIHNKQFYTRLGLDWYRVGMLPGCFDCTPAYSSTSTVGNFLIDLSRKDLFRAAIILLYYD